MQQPEHGQYLYSPSDLVTFLGCRHASFLDFKSLSEDLEPAEDNAMAQLLQQKGLEHEAAYLQRLKDEGRTVTEIPQNLNLEERTALTVEAMHSGVDVVYQAVLFQKPWRGYADFLMKCDAPSSEANDLPKSG